VVVVAARGLVKNLNGEHVVVVAIVLEDDKVTDFSDHALALAVGGYLFSAIGPTVG
jgi:hypothetical protein